VRGGGIETRPSIQQAWFGGRLSKYFSSEKVNCFRTKGGGAMSVVWGIRRGANEHWEGRKRAFSEN